MPVVIPPGVAQVAHIFESIATPNGAAVTYGVQVGFAENPENVAATLHGAFDDSILNQLSYDLALVRTLVKFGPNASGPSGEYAETAVGSITETSAPPNTAILVQKRTATGGRRGRGRFFLPGVPELQVNGSGNLQSAYIEDLQGDVDIFLNFIDTSGFPMVLLHDNLSDPAVVTKLAVAGTVATQRRRLRK